MTEAHIPPFPPSASLEPPSSGCDQWAMPQVISFQTDLVSFWRVHPVEDSFYHLSSRKEILMRVLGTVFAYAGTIAFVSTMIWLSRIIPNVTLMKIKILNAAKFVVAFAFLAYFLVVSARELFH